jgi:serine/threonine protein kinase/Tfp pilus assembly protein PilF
MADLPTPPEPAETIDAPAARRPRPQHQDPESIGPYRILERVGEGGMGLVYKADQRQPVRRIVALKVIKLGMDTSEVVARFEAERQALAMMSHPNVAKVFEAGVTEQGRPYFAMEFVAGVPLTDYCDQNKLTTRQRLELFIPVCHAVQHAHQKGIIHRDLKPSNILVALFDGQPVPKVIDFGIAKATNQALTQRTLYTQTGSLIGTPEYMSPEQAMTNGLDVDTRTDVYALGVILYELLVGSVPFDPKTLRAQGLDGIARIIKETEPQKPSTRINTLAVGRRADSNPSRSLDEVAQRHRTDARSLRREIRGDLDWITLKAMEKDRTRRYETANGLAQDIRRHLDNEPVSARPPSTLYRLGKLARKHRAAAVATIAVAAALLIAIIGTSIGIVRTRQALHKAEIAEASANEQKRNALSLLEDVKKAKAAAEVQAKRAEAANQFMRGMLGSTSPGKSGEKGTADLKVTDMLDRAMAQLDALKGQPEMELDGRLTLASTYLSLDQADKAVENYKRAVALSRGISGSESEQTLQITADLLLAMTQSNPAAALALARESVATAGRVLGPRHPITLDMRNSLGSVLFAAGLNSGAEQIFRDLIQEARQSGSLAHGGKGSARFFNNLAMVLSSQGRSAEAEQLQREAIEVAKAEKDPDARRTAKLLHNLGKTLYAENKLAEAQKAYAQALQYERKELGDSHPETLTTTMALAELFEQQGQFGEALPLRQELSKRLFLTQREESFDVLVQRFIAAELQLRLGQEQAARQIFVDTIAKLRKLAQKDDAQEAVARNWWAYAQLLGGLRTDRAWSGPAIQAQAAHVAWLGLMAHSWGEPALDSVDWSKLRFKIEGWNGAAAVQGGGAIEGGLSELWTTADPKPGVYLISVFIPRRDAKEIRSAHWMLVAPWKLSLHSSPNLDGRAQEQDIKKVLAATPTEERLEPTLCYDRFGMIGRGFGPFHGVDGYLVDAVSSSADMPAGEYRLRAFSDGRNRVFVDGRVLLDSAENLNIIPIRRDEGPGHELRVQWSQGSRQLRLTVEPASREADAKWIATVGPLNELEAASERLDDQIARAKPVTAVLLAERGFVRASSGRFDEADDDLAKAIALDPTDHWAWYHRGTLLAYLGKSEAHHELSRAMVERFKKTPDASIAERTAKTCLMLPGSVDDPALMLKLMDQAVASGGQYLAWFQMGKGIAEYRAGHYRAADEVLATAKKTFPTGHAAVTCLLFRAMALHKLGNSAEAATMFQAALSDLRQFDEVPGKQDLNGTTGLENWFVCHVALREAQQALATDAPGTQPATQSVTQPAAQP